jgi:hypothetical protein
VEVPRTLRTWFLVDAAVDVLGAAALLVAPELVLGRLGWTCVDPVAARIVGAAMLAIGGQSFLGRDAGVEVYRAMLQLKMLWSFAAAGALFVGIGAGAPPAAWAFLSMFIIFAGVWLHHAIRFRQLARVSTTNGPAEPDEAAADDSPEGDAGREA